MIKLLIGGSPCTFWSIAQKNNRETEAEGMGWELFKNYLVAKEKFKPDFFLYENNKSAAKAIKDQIKKELKVYDGSLLTEDTGARYIEINSALVSAQNRQRFYVHNCGEVEQPEDRGVLVKDIMEQTTSEQVYELKHISTKPIKVAQTAKGGGIGSNTGLYAKPVRIGDIGSTAQAHRVYSCYGKSVTINAGGGGQGGKTGLYFANCDGRNNYYPVYEVKDGLITIEGKQYPIKLADGFYIIRKLTVTECARLQTMPDDYCKAVSDAQAYTGLGNGWTAEVIIHILNGALKDISKNEEIVVLSMYDGIGTGRYCLDKMGFTNVKYYAYEIDKYAKQIAMSNYPDIIQCGDAFDLRHPDWTIGY